MNMKLKCESKFDIGDIAEVDFTKLSVRHTSVRHATEIEAFAVENIETEYCEMNVETGQLRAIR